MKGKPKHLNTQKDYEYLRANFPPEVWRPAFQALLDDRFQNFCVGSLSDGEVGVIDATHSVVEEHGMNGVVRYQYETREYEDAAIFVLGFTVAEVQVALNEE